MPRQVLLPKGMKILQTKGPGRILSKSKYEITKQIPVVFAAEGRNVPLEPGKAQQVMAGRNNFKILISSSIHVAPTPAFEGVAEGSGYILEYLFIRE